MIRAEHNLTADDDNHWNVSDWWAHNLLDGQQMPIDLNFERMADKVEKSAGLVRGRGRERSDLWTSATDRYDTFDYEDDQRSATNIPSSSAKSIKNLILEHFTRVRSHLADSKYFRKIKRNLKQYFVNLGLTTAAQSFWPPEMVSIYQLIINLECS